MHKELSAQIESRGSFELMFADPQKNIDQFGLQAGMRVADIGSGSGFYALAAAQAVTSKGSVLAIDVQQDLLAKLSNEARRQGISNIQTIWGDVEKLGGTKLADKSVDAAIISNVLFQAESREGVIAETLRILKPGGKALVIDWTDAFGGMGPHPEAVVTRAMAEDLFEKAGFMLDHEIQAGAHHYGLIYKKK
jgi:ubiquinone/menaquinone biosynthesis C-methylase UbiE